MCFIGGLDIDRKVKIPFQLKMATRFAFKIKSLLENRFPSPNPAFHLQFYCNCCCSLIFDSTKLQTKQKKISILFPISDNLVQSRFFSFSREKSCILLKWWKIHKCFSFILKYKFIYSLFPVQYETRFFRFLAFFILKYSRDLILENVWLLL